MEKINIAKILRDCPQGMELDYALFEDTIFIGVEEDKNYPIIIKLKDGSQKRLTKYGCHSNADHAKCVIFPKGKTTWEGFQTSFRDGDIVATNSVQMFILQRAESNTKGYCYIGYDFECNEFFDAGVWEFDGLATEEEKQKLFDAIKANGYRWNDETKTLENLVEPKFKVGNKVKHKCDKNNTVITITGSKHNYYYIQYYNNIKNDYQNEKLSFTDQDKYELIIDKFDINTLKPFDKVLVRTDNKHRWSIQFFERLNNTLKDSFVCMGRKRYHQCIPYKGNEHLLNTVNDCEDYFKTWQKS